MFLYILFSLVVACLFIHPLLSLLVRQYLSPLARLPGPPSPSILLGNLAAMDDQENSNILFSWINTYGSTFVYRGFLGGARLLTVDPVAIRYILAHAYDFPKPSFVRDSLAAMAAGHQGLLTVEGEDHRRQRRILGPAFTHKHIKSLRPIFWEKAVQLRDTWLSMHATHASQSAPSQPFRVDVLVWLSRATLDIIGHAGFGYHFHSLSTAADAPAASSAMDNPNELARAFSVIFSTARKLRLITILQAWIPILRGFRRNNKTMNQAKATMRRIGMELIEERDREVMVEQAASRYGVTCKDVTGNPGLCKADQATSVKAASHPFPASSDPITPPSNPVDRVDGDKSVLGRDLLSVLIRSNHASSAKQRMSLEEILCQISTFITAGHETVSSALTWCLYALARDQAVQDRLRAALRALPPPPPSSGGCPHELMDEIERCVYLDWVVRETLRVHSPVTATMREVGRAVDEIPLGRGVRERGEDAAPRGAPGSVRVHRGDIITIPIQAVNKSVDVWGPDAVLFRPERWGEVRAQGAGAETIPGMYAGVLTFLNGGGGAGGAGNRACIGWKFALDEIKILLYVLVRDVEFGIDPGMVIEKKINVVTRPFVKSEPELGNQMPLYVRPVGSSVASPPSVPPPPPPPPPRTPGEMGSVFGQAAV